MAFVCDDDWDIRVKAISQIGENERKGNNGIDLKSNYRFKGLPFFTSLHLIRLIMTSAEVQKKIYYVPLFFVTHVLYTSKQRLSSRLL